MDEQGSDQAFQYAMRNTKTLVPMRQSLFTFSPTSIHYVIVTELLNQAGVELRSGKLSVERPAILTPTMLFEQYFEGFDSDQRKHLENMVQSGGLRGLRYK